MQTFTLLPRDFLSPRHFERWPAWAACTASEDIDEIVAWGLDRQTVTDQIAEVGYSDEFVFPVLRTAPLPSFQYLYLSARITAADGTEFAGYVLGPDSYFVAVFHNSEEYGFNARLPDLGDAELARLRLNSGLKLSPFLPLRYVTPLQRDDGRRIEGVFDYGCEGEQMARRD